MARAPRAEDDRGPSPSLLQKRRRASGAGLSGRHVRRWRPTRDRLAHLEHGVGSAEPPNQDEHRIDQRHLAGWIEPEMTGAEGQLATSRP